MAPTGDGSESSQTQGDELCLVLDNAIGAVEAGQRQLEAYLEPYGLASIVLHRVEVIFEEVVSNAVRHGFTPGSDQSIIVRITVGTDLIDMVFEDDGVPFDPLQAPAPAPFGALEDAKLGGLGIAMVIRLAHGVRYERPESTDAGFRPANRLTVTVAATA